MESHVKARLDFGCVERMGCGGGQEGRLGRIKSAIRSLVVFSRQVT